MAVEVSVALGCITCTGTIIVPNSDIKKHCPTCETCFNALYSLDSVIRRVERLGGIKVTAEERNQLKKFYAETYEEFVKRYWDKKN